MPDADGTTDNRRMSRRQVLTGIGASVGTGGLFLTPTHATTREATMPDGTRLIRLLTTADLPGAELQPGDWAETTGYHEPGDGGAALYRVRPSADGPAADGGAVLAAGAGLVADLTEGESVNYAMFGARGEYAVWDDGEPIKAAHVFANEHDLPVVERGREYWIGDTHAIEIRTPVDWGRTVFHVDERWNRRDAPRFVVRNDDPDVELPLDELKEALLAGVRPGAQLIPELARWPGHLISLRDDNDRIGIRAGNYSKSGWPREELFYVEEEGRVIGDIAWEFSDLTHARAIPCPDNVIVIEGGTFYLTGASPENSTPGYHHNGMRIERSRTIVRNQFVGLEPGRSDDSMEPRHGSYLFSHVYDVTLENIRCMPWEKNRPGGDRDVKHGTYGIGGNRMLNCTFRNLTAEAGWVSWGVFGTNLNKNFLVENCRLNRIDVHFHCWNLTIRDCEIGFKGISVTGGGDLLIENTVRHGNSFVAFRPDYGSRWEGRVRLRGCTLRPTGEGRVAVLQYRPQDFDYRYQLGYGRDIEIDDLRIDYAAAPASTAPCWLLQLAEFSRTADGGRLFFPRNLRVRGVRVVGREAGVRLLRLDDAGHFDLGAAGGESRANARLTFEDVQLEPVVVSGDGDDAHLVLAAPEGYADERALYPDIHISRCDGLFAVFEDAAADVVVEASRINSLHASGLRGRLRLRDCLLQPEVVRSAGESYRIDSSGGTRLTDCTLATPVVDGEVDPARVSGDGVIDSDGGLRHYHLNTGLDAALARHLRASGVLTPELVARLRSHHLLDDA
jgi:hypothetical protein